MLQPHAGSEARLPAWSTRPCPWQQGDNIQNRGPVASPVICVTETCRTLSFIIDPAHSAPAVTLGTGVLKLSVRNQQAPQRRDDRGATMHSHANVSYLRGVIHAFSDVQGTIPTDAALLAVQRKLDSLNGPGLCAYVPHRFDCGFELLNPCII